MRSLQEIFNVAIDAGVYYPHYGGTAECGAYRSEFMCNALHSISGSFGVELITDAEYEYAVAEIQAYIREYTEDDCTLCMILKEQGKPYNFEARLAIYKDWANRPRWEHTNANTDQV